MPAIALLGAQWGDEGKGKATDLLGDRADYVVKFNGGNNAGHTIVVGNTVYKLSLLPSGLVQGKLSVIGNGVVVDPWALAAEIESGRAQGLTITPDLLVLADNACMVLPLHRDLDAAREARAGAGKIGTTGRGIGPTASISTQTQSPFSADGSGYASFATRTTPTISLPTLEW